MNNTILTIPAYYNTSSAINQVSLNESNWAFVDMQNFYRGIKQKGWRINWDLFRKYLSSIHNVTRAVLFMGYIKENEYLYKLLRKSGFIIEFRQVMILDDGTIDGGNVDADLACYALDNKAHYSKAVIIADDGDYCKTVQTLNKQQKLKLVISSHSIKETSHLIKQAIGHKMIISVHDLKSAIEQKTNIK